ncbi:MAG: hypothetical protein MRY64_09320 [Hyphomonadaceae bacterium]|nr:hypothetical protein [Hyphomonadaceae bacterium]
MVVQAFSFGDALSHFSKTPSPARFIIKFTLAYALFYGLAFALIGALIGPAYIRLFEVMANSPMGEPDPDEVMGILGPILGGYALAFPLMLLVWAMLEGCVQRQYVRDRGFTLALGGDEWRLIVVGLLYGLVFFALYIGFAIVVFVPVGIIGAAAASGGGDGAAVLAGLVAVVLGIAAFCAMIFIMVRLSPAAAMTVRDRKIQFAAAWGASKGRFWQMFGAYAVIYIVSAIAGQVLQLVLVFGLMGAIIPNVQALEAGDFSGVVTSPTLWISLGLMLIGYAVLYAATHFVSAGVPALVAKTDPNWAGDGSAVRDAFS